MRWYRDDEDACTSDSNDDDHEGAAFTRNGLEGWMIEGWMDGWFCETHNFATKTK